MTFKKILFGTIIGVSLLSAGAQGQDFDIYVGGSDRYQERGHDRYQERGDDGHSDRGRPRRNLGPCDPEVALDHAEEYGMRRVRIASITRDRIVVTGIGSRGERTHMVILNDSRCNRIR